MTEIGPGRIVMLEGRELEEEIERGRCPNHVIMTWVLTCKRCSKIIEDHMAKLDELDLLEASRVTG